MEKISGKKGNGKFKGIHNDRKKTEFQNFQNSQIGEPFYCKSPSSSGSTSAATGVECNGLVRSKHIREIQLYRPPSMRRGSLSGENNDKSSSRENYSEPFAPSTANTPYNNRLGQPQTTSTTFTTTCSSSSGSTRKSKSSLNIHAKEFLPTYANCSSNSSRENLINYHLKRQQNQQFNQSQNQILICEDLPKTTSSNYNATYDYSAPESRQNQSSSGNKIHQSKSSGHIPAAAIVVKQRVHFQDEKEMSKIKYSTETKNTFCNSNINNSQVSTKSGNGLLTQPVIQSQEKGGDDDNEALVVKSQKTLETLQINPKVRPQMLLQKSRTTSISCNTSLNNYFPHQNQPKPLFLQQTQTSTATNTAVSQPPKRQDNNLLLLQIPCQNQKQPSAQIQRSKSFAGPSIKKDHNSLLNEFEYFKWPREIQMGISQGVKGVDKLSARVRIELVTRIFEVMLKTSSESPAGGDGEKVDASKNVNMTLPAVNILLYFIQREKDRTVMESLLNTCYSFYQENQAYNHQYQGGEKEENSSSAESTALRWNIFLQFLSSLYSQVKMIRLQRKQQQGKALEEMNLAILSLLCDSCLSTIHSHLSQSAGTMECLFNVFTSLGKDMEVSFPLKMKQILALVRDSLLGIGSAYSPAPELEKSSQSSQKLSLNVQKTLFMEIIELSAARWSLPVSAIRYYYNSTNNHHN